MVQFWCYCFPILQGVGLNFSYSFHMTNAKEDDLLRHEFSADEFCKIYFKWNDFIFITPSEQFNNPIHNSNTIITPSEQFNNPIHNSSTIITPSEQFNNPIHNPNTQTNHSLLSWVWYMVLGLWCLTLLSTIFQLYRGCQFYQWRRHGTGTAINNDRVK
jgi:hypothetical protein